LHVKQQNLFRHTDDTCGWLPNTPDLNPVDYNVWGTMQQRSVKYQRYQHRLQPTNIIEAISELCVCELAFVPDADILIPW